MLFRLVIHDTKEDNKYCAEERHEFLGDIDAIWYLWYVLTEIVGKRHVEVFNIAGVKQCPEEGIKGMYDYSV